MQKTKKVGIIGSALAATVVCTGLIAGSTYALFTSNDQVDITISSATVDVTASIVGLEGYSPESIDFGTYLAVGTENGAVDSEDGLGSTFANGGTAKVVDGNLQISNMTPGDKVTVNVELTNNSTAAIQYRVKLLGDTANKGFYDNLLISVDGEYYGNYVSAWKGSEAFTDGTAGIALSIELPTYVGNEYAGDDCKFSVAVEAVQGNAAVSDADSLKTYLVDDQAELTQTVAAMQDGETVVLMGGNKAWGNAKIAFEDEKTVYVRGYNVGTLTVDAPDGSIYYITIRK